MTRSLTRTPAAGLNRPVRDLLRSVAIAGVLLGGMVGSQPVAADELDDLFAPMAMTPEDLFAAPIARTASRLEIPAASVDGPTGSNARRMRNDRQEPSTTQMPSAATIRQARALIAAEQRQARLEAARWSGQPILRPTWSGLGGPGHALPGHSLTVPIYVGGGWFR